MFVGTFVFSAPFLMFVYQWEQDQLTTRLAGDFEDVDELLEDVRAGAHSQDSGTLERTVFLPFFNAVLAE